MWPFISRHDEIKGDSFACGSCRGLALKVARKNAASVLGYLHDREMMNSVYLPKWLPVRLPSENVTAYAFIAVTNNTPAGWTTKTPSSLSCRAAASAGIA